MCSRVGRRAIRAGRVDLQYRKWDDGTTWLHGAPHDGARAPHDVAAYPHAAALVDALVAAGVPVDVVTKYGTALHGRPLAHAIALEVVTPSPSRCTTSIQAAAFCHKIRRKAFYIRRTAHLHAA